MPVIQDPVQRAGPCVEQMPVDQELAESGYPSRQVSQVRISIDWSGRAVAALVAQAAYAQGSVRSSVAATTVAIA